jgi:hypothetical protein
MGGDLFQRYTYPKLEEFYKAKTIIAARIQQPLIRIIPTRRDSDAIRKEY